MYSLRPSHRAFIAVTPYLGEALAKLHLGAIEDGHVRHKARIVLAANRNVATAAACIARPLAAAPLLPPPLLPHSSMHAMVAAAPMMTCTPSLTAAAPSTLKRRAIHGLIDLAKLMVGIVHLVGLARLAQVIVGAHRALVPRTSDWSRMAAVTLDTMVHDVGRAHGSKGVLLDVHLFTRCVAGGTEVEVRALLTPVPCTNNG
mmetsp:Transcript_39177/g.63508  ORF Transcript_39177/g.63508 Transcript_39177/m.63508 type:complete len:202 (-) Transcript_39177:127-732(-)